MSVDIDNGAAMLGFADPVHDAQHTFRAALEALARPGRLQTVAPPQEQPGDLAPAAVALVLALADIDTPVWLADARSTLADYLRFHCGCPIVDDPQAAAFALGRSTDLPALDAFHPGDDLAPERAATVIVSVDALETTSASEVWLLSGPGIADTHRLACRRAPAGFTDFWADNKQRFPAGIDLFFAAGDTLAGLPRTTVIRET